MGKFIAILDFSWNVLFEKDVHRIAYENTV